MSTTLFWGYSRAAAFIQLLPRLTENVCCNPLVRLTHWMATTAAPARLGITKALMCT